MDWSNERYVRFYTRNTPEWLSLSWQARALMGLLIREVDRSGVLPSGKLGRRAVAVALRAPWPEIEQPLAELLEDGCVQEGDGIVFIPNFQEAQEAIQSDRHRAREYRERRRDDAGRRVTPRDGGVTKRDGDDSASRFVTEASRNVTDPSRGVTEHHAASRSVTPSDPILPSQPSESQTRAIPPSPEPGEDPDPEPAPGTEPRAGVREALRAVPDLPDAPEAARAPDVPTPADGAATRVLVRLRELSGVDVVTDRQVRAWTLERIGERGEPRVLRAVAAVLEPGRRARGFVGPQTVLSKQTLLEEALALVDAAIAAGADWLPADLRPAPRAPPRPSSTRARCATCSEPIPCRCCREAPIPDEDAAALAAWLGKPAAAGGAP